MSRCFSFAIADITDVRNLRSVDALRGAAALTLDILLHLYLWAQAQVTGRGIRMGKGTEKKFQTHFNFYYEFGEGWETTITMKNFFAVVGTHQVEQ